MGSKVDVRYDGMIRSEHGTQHRMDSEHSHSNDKCHYDGGGPEQLSDGQDYRHPWRTGHTAKQEGVDFVVLQPSGDVPCAQAAGKLDEEELDREEELDELFRSVGREVDVHLHEDGKFAVFESTVKPAMTPELPRVVATTVAPSDMVLEQSCCFQVQLKTHVAPMTTLDSKLQSPCCTFAMKDQISAHGGGAKPSEDLLKELFSPVTGSTPPLRPIRPQPSCMNTPNRYTVTGSSTCTSFITPTIAGVVRETNYACKSSTRTPNMEGRGVQTRTGIWATPLQTSGLPSGGRPTPPLCKCGRRAKRQTVVTPGPNDGRHFFACPLGKVCSSKGGCGFFKWADSPSASVMTSPDLLGSEYDDAVT